ncbi:unnamed protein product [Tenebrio molitor]|nr:unnamed protein product [Tenebrio molitor]
MYKLFYLILVGSIITDAKPVPLIGSDYYSSIGNLFRLPITFGIGTIGVNFLGFHASAGVLGGLFGENLLSPGGPHAEGSTPWGQSAGAGVGIRLQHGKVIGYLYARATFGNKEHIVTLPTNLLETVGYNKFHLLL